VSPEQARGEPTGPESDVFSLGSVIYEMLAGRRAFEGATTVDRLAAVLHLAPEPLGALVRDLPPEVARIVERCLEKVPARRFKDAQELATALQAVLTDSGRRRAVAGTRSTGARRTRALAVLPFDITPPNPDAEFLGDGLAESIINSLTAVPRLRVVPRSTMFRYKGRGMDAGAVGRDVDATSVLAGHLSWRGDMLQLQVELVDPVNDAQVWGQQYTRRTDDIFALQEALARDISEALKVRLASAGKRRDKRLAPNADAYQDYLRGRFHAAQYSPHGFTSAITCFEAAVAKDPDYAQAHAELGDAIATARFFGYVLPDESLARAREATARALALDSHIAAAHASRAKQAFLFERDFAAAEASFARALTLAPSFAECRMFSGLLDLVCGRTAQGLAAGRRAIEEAPRSPLVNAGLSALLLFARDIEGAIAQGQRTVALDPGSFLGRQMLLFSLEHARRFEEALEQLPPLFAAYGLQPESHERVRRAWQEGGERRYWEARLAVVQEQLARRYTPPQFQMYLYAKLGDFDGAMAWAERLFQIDSGMLVFLGIDPIIDALREDPRFLALLRRCGLPVIVSGSASQAAGPAAG